MKEYRGRGNGPSKKRLRTKKRKKNETRANRLEGGGWVPDAWFEDKSQKEKTKRLGGFRKFFRYGHLRRGDSDLGNSKLLKQNSARKTNMGDHFRATERQKEQVGRKDGRGVNGRSKTDKKSEDEPKLLVGNSLGWPLINIKVEYTPKQKVREK